MASTGVMNRLLMDLHVIAAPVDWLGSPGIAFGWLMAVAVFVSLPFTTYVILAGLQSIPQEVFEAARVDGASPSAHLSRTSPCRCCGRRSSWPRSST